MKLGSREADEAYDRWHDRMADEYFGANDEDACEICGGDQDAMNELTADAERFRALRDMSANFAWRYAEAKRNGFDLADAITADLPSIPGVVAILNAEDFTAAVDELMRSNVELEYGLQTITFETANVNEFKVECNEGGTVTVTFRVQARPTEEQLARLFALLDTSVPITITPPEEKLQQDLKKAA